MIEGTDFSTPTMAALISIMKQKYPDLSQDELVQKLKEEIKEITDVGYFDGIEEEPIQPDYYGWTLIDEETGEIIKFDLYD